MSEMVVTTSGVDSLPEGWVRRRLGEFVTTKRGITYNSTQLGDSNQNLPLYLNMKSFLKNGGYNVKGDKFYNASYRERDLLRNRDLLIANTDVTPTGDILGVPLLVPSDKQEDKVLYSHHVTALNLKDDISLEFIYYLFCSPIVRSEMHKNGRGTTVKMLDVGSLLKYSVVLPPLPEQQKIASILTSVDEVIEKTQTQINKLQDLKKGTMNELLTKGIGHTEFKDSPVGKIPKGWGVVSVDDLCAKVFVGIATSTTHAYTDDSGVAILRNQNIKDGRIDSSDLLFITKEFSEENSTKKLQKGDVITARTGYPGISSVVSDNFVGCHSFTTLISRPYQDKVMPEFFARLFNSEQGQYVVSQMQAGGAQQNLNVEMMKKILMPLPSTQEQQQISSILSSIDKNIEEKQHKLEQTQSLKKSLMQDLLTGKVRVPLQ